MWKQVADFNPRLTTFLELPGRFQNLSNVCNLSFFELANRFMWILPVIFVEHRLGVKGINLTYPTFHKQKYHMFGFRLEMGLPQGSRRFFNRASTGLICHQSSQGQLAKPVCMSGQPLASRDVIAALIRILLHLYFLSSVSDDQSRYRNSLVSNIA